MRETIEQEHFRLSQLQSLLKDDVNKVIKLIILSFGNTFTKWHPNNVNFQHLLKMAI